MSRSRFSLLLLDEGEYYFDDFGAYRHCGSGGGGGMDWGSGVVKGRLKLCSASIFFDPDDFRLPILRYPFSGVQSVGPAARSRMSQLTSKESLFEVVCETVVAMKADGHDAPYEFIRAPTRHIFSLQFEPMEQFLPRLDALVTLTQRENYETRETVLSNLIHRKEEQVKFDVAWIESLSEKTLLEVSANRITPLAALPGRLMLTNERLYFQPLNNTDSVPVYKIALASIVQIQKRRHLLRHVGLEVESRSAYDVGSQRPNSMFLAFRSVGDRNAFHQLLVSQLDAERAPLPDAQQIQRAMARWMRGELSNFEYLMFLNSMAGRTFNDLTQYPVMPFVLADYTSATLDLSDPRVYRDLSKPIGALNPTRLRNFKERYAQMPEPRFLYGSHYSTPGYVLYYLVRRYPEYTLRLQNGKFDAPDRMFYSMPQCWHNVLHNSSDVKELIPEFYERENGGDFLVNALHLDFGYLTNGEKIDDVVLPPWARSPRDFVAKLREALESDHVSERLHLWIDLVFGCKQRGEAAVRADNLFYYLTYEGAVDMESVRDPVERRSLEAQISEFGQTPKQIFLDPHPKRFDSYEDEMPRGSIRHSNPSMVPSGGSSPLVSATPSFGQPPSLSAKGSAFDDDSSEELEEGDGLSSRGVQTSISAVRLHTLDDAHEQGVTLPLPLSRTTEALASGIDPEPTKEKKTPKDEGEGIPEPLVWPGFGGLSESVEFDQRTHKDVVTDVWLAEDTFSSVSQDGLLKVFSLSETRQLRSFSPSAVSLSCSVVSRDGKTVVCGCWDNSVYVYSYTSGRIVSQAQGHYDAVSALSLHEPSKLLLSGSWDTTVKLWSLEGATISRVPLADLGNGSAEARSAAFSASGRLAAVGFQNGTVGLYDIRTKRAIRELRPHSGSVRGLHFSADELRLLTAAEDGSLRSYDAVANQSLEVVDLGAPLYCLRSDGYSALVGDKAGRLSLVSLASRSVVFQRVVHTCPVTALDLSPSSSRLIAGFSDGRIKLFSLK